MFTNEEIQSMNNLELEVYKYVIENMNEIPKMKIRDLADKVHVSTSTVLRFCQKVHCDGYSELRLKIKMHLNIPKASPISESLGTLESFLKLFTSDEYQKKLDDAVELISRYSNIMFFGSGSSGTMGKYGARYFSNLGSYAISIDDPYYPTPTGTIKNTVLVVLSVSGTTKEPIEQLEFFKGEGAPVITITSNPDSTLAKMADINISYSFPLEYIDIDDNVTSQVPVILILESLARKLHNKKIQ